MCLNCIVLALEGDFLFYDNFLVYFLNNLVENKENMLIYFLKYT